MRRDLFWAAAILLTGSVLSAQVPVGQGVRFSSNSAVGHEIIDPATGITIPVTGLSAQDAFTSCGTIDPVTGELWTSGEGFSRGRVVRVSLSGAVGSASLVVDTGDDTHSAMDFDWNGDVYLCSAGEVVKVERATGLPTSWDTNNYPGLFNALCIDMAANKMYVGTFDDGTGSVLIEYDLGAGPGPGTIIADFTASGFVGSISGCDDNGFGIVYVSDWDPAQPIYAVDVFTGAITPLAGAPGTELNDLWLDRRSANLACIDAGLLNFEYYTVDLLGATTLTTTPGTGSGVAGSCAVNDFTDRTEVFPQRPSASTDFTLEVAAHGELGDIAGAAVVAINGVPVNPIVLGAAVCDVGGFATFAAPVLGSTVTPGDQYSVLTARVTTTGFLVLGNQVEVIVQP